MYSALRRLLETVRDQSVDSKKEFEALYKDVIMINMQLEMKVLELQDQLSRSGGVGGKNHSYSLTGKISTYDPQKSAPCTR